MKDHGIAITDDQEEYGCVIVDMSLLTMHDDLYTGPTKSASQTTSNSKSPLCQNTD